jgi:hypothetical protein
MGAEGRPAVWRVRERMGGPMRGGAAAGMRAVGVGILEAKEVPIIIGLGLSVRSHMHFERIE